MSQNEQDPSQDSQRPENKQESVRREKLKAWREKREEIDRVKDSLGCAIDQKIREAIVGLNVLGVYTLASCEGHIGRARSTPWIRIGAPHRPRERFIDERRVLEETARKYGVSYDDVRGDICHKAWVEAMNAAAEKDETPEYKRWRQENTVLFERTARMLAEFYEQRNVSPDLRLVMLANAEGSFTIHHGGQDYTLDQRNLDAAEKNALAERLERYQTEIQAFTAFLRQKYFGTP
jgi:hypothetical protein